MLRSIKSINVYILNAQDGHIGRCKDFLFDDEFWTIRYMVADTGKWLPGRLVLISPISLGEPDWEQRLFSVRLTKDQIKDSPGIEEKMPVSVQNEIELFRYYGWSYYWVGTHAWGSAAYPTRLYDKNISNEKKSEKSNSRKDHLRSTNEVQTYHIQATDDEIGHVEDFIVDDCTWTIRYVVVDTRNWLPGKKVLVSPDWVHLIDWDNRKVHIDLTRTKIKDCPEYDPSMPINREYEEKLHDFYGRLGYWTK